MFSQTYLIFFQAIEGVSSLRRGYWTQKMVPLKEMTDVLRVFKDIVQVKPKSWVRIKRGIYKEDVAQVGSSIWFLDPTHSN